MQYVPLASPRRNAGAPFDLKSERLCCLEEMQLEGVRLDVILADVNPMLGVGSPRFAPR